MTKYSLEELSQFLDEIVLDAHLEEQEKRMLQNIVLKLQADEKNYMRNQAFKKANHQLHEAQFSVGSIMRWLERVVKQVTNHDKDTPALPSSAYFSPGYACKNKIIELITSAKRSLKICVFTITDDDIVDAIIKAHKRGVVVKVISDNDKAHDLGSDVQHIQNQGIAVALDTSTAHMHHKFMLVDKRVLLNGSFNWTRSASKYNQENIVVSYDEDLLAAFHDEFERLWAEFG